MSPATDQERPRNTHCPPYHGWCHPLLSHTLFCSSYHPVCSTSHCSTVCTLYCSQCHPVSWHPVPWVQFTLFNIALFSDLCTEHSTHTIPFILHTTLIQTVLHDNTTNTYNTIQHNDNSTKTYNTIQHNDKRTNTSNSIQPEPSMFGIWHQIRVTGSPAFFSSKTLASQNAADDSFCFNFYHSNHFNQCLSKCCWLSILI